MKVNLEGMTREQIDAMTKDQMIDKCMEDWRNRPTTQMCFAMLDKIETKEGRLEVVNALLRDCFDYAGEMGCEFGRKETMSGVVDSITRAISRAKEKANGQVQPGPVGQA